MCVCVRECVCVCVCVCRCWALCVCGRACVCVSLSEGTIVSVWHYRRWALSCSNGLCPFLSVTFPAVYRGAMRVVACRARHPIPTTYPSVIVSIIGTILASWHPKHVLKQQIHTAAVFSKQPACA